MKQQEAAVAAAAVAAALADDAVSDDAARNSNRGSHGSSSSSRPARCRRGGLGRGMPVVVHWWDGLVWLWGGTKVDRFGVEALAKSRLYTRPMPYDPRPRLGVAGTVSPGSQPIGWTAPID